jgi:predicted metalloprotease with PDZ domain
MVPRSLLVAALSIASITPAHAATSEIALAVDARDVGRHILHVRETVPARPGALSLSYPKWIPGEHGPTGPLIEIINLVVTAGGQRLAWRRDDVDLFAIHCTVPAGGANVDLAFDFALTTSAAGFSSAASASENLLLLSWNQVLLYPTGKPADALEYRASVTLPEGWRYGTALHAAGTSGARVDFAPVTLERLIDSPLLTGRHYRSVDLAVGSHPPCTLEMACESEAGLQIPDSTVAAHRRLVREARALFGGTRYGEYHFLLSLSDRVAHFGLEHHESSDDRTVERLWVNDDFRRAGSGLLSHEYVHSWNGKYRRPAGLATPDYTQPMKDELLWVYEGLTQYLGWVLASRSGLRSTQEGLDDLARVTARLNEPGGRMWRPLEDTAVEASLLYDARGAWASARRGVDFYDEGLLLWLDADVTIRRLTHGAKSLDDFCHLFHGGDGPVQVKPYEFDDVVRALNAVAPNDWATFLRDRVERVQAHPPLAGITQGGWTPAWVDSATGIFKSREIERAELDESGSIGVVLEEKTGKLSDVVPGSAAERAGVAPDMTLIAVNGRHWSKDVLLDAIRATRTGGPLELLLENDELFRTFRLEYREGPRYPALARAPATPDVIGEILKPHAPAGEGSR